MPRVTDECENTANMWWKLDNSHGKLLHFNWHQTMYWIFYFTVFSCAFQMLLVICEQRGFKLLCDSKEEICRAIYKSSFFLQIGRQRSLENRTCSCHHLLTDWREGNSPMYVWSRAVEGGKLCFYWGFNRMPLENSPSSRGETSEFESPIDSRMAQDAGRIHAFQWRSEISGDVGSRISTAETQTSTPTRCCDG
jgi:hypothetical protein